MKQFIQVFHSEFKKCETAYQITVLTVLASMSRNGIRVCFPKIDTICQRSFLSRSKVIDVLKELEANKVIKITKENGKINHYTLLLSSNFKKEPMLNQSVRNTPPVREKHPTSPSHAPHKKYTNNRELDSRTRLIELGKESVSYEALRGVKSEGCLDDIYSAWNEGKTDLEKENRTTGFIETAVLELFGKVGNIGEIVKVIKYYREQKLDYSFRLKNFCSSPSGFAKFQADMKKENAPLPGTKEYSYARPNDRN